MRISDWSSDVCSSDLLDSFGRFIEQQQRRLACQGPADRQLLLLSPRQHARLAVGDLGQLGKQVIRSEEHTSELQSLMRISYAVFCLKKKKKNIPTTYTIQLMT